MNVSEMTTSELIQEDSLISSNLECFQFHPDVLAMRNFLRERREIRAELERRKAAMEAEYAAEMDTMERSRSYLV
jgi:hypothetical protein